jgi:YidC/Oxa1 family membrane protein insertase
MDRKSIIVLAACFVLIMLWMPLMNWIWPPKPGPLRPTNTPPALALASTNAANATNAEAVTLPHQTPAVAPRSFLTPAAREETLEVTNDLAHYTFTSHGGGLKLVQLVRFPESATTSATTTGKQPNQTQPATLNAMAPAPVLAQLSGSGAEGDGVFSLSRTATGVRAEKTLTNGLVLVKDYAVGSNYLVTASVRWTNTSTQPLSLPVQQWCVGTATPMAPGDNGLSVGLMWYDGKSPVDIGQSWFDNKSIFSCVGLVQSQPRTEYRAGTTNVVWSAVHNQFFALVAIPREKADAVVARPVALSLPSEWVAATLNRPPPTGIETALVYPAVTLAPGKSLERQFELFAGPKEYRVLSRIGEASGNDVDLVMGFSGFFGFFAKVLLLSMNGLHDLLRLGYGWVIILITVIIKAVFWPLTQISTRSMKRMQALQPQMNALREKYKDDPAKMNTKLMEFMKEHKVSPLGGCLPMVIQLPIFFGFYRMIQSAIELRGAHFLWVQDLAKPDTLFRIHMGGFDVPFNLLPLIMGGTMLWQARLTPPSPGADPMQQKMMKYMPLMFLFMLYNFSAGLTLYWTVQNLLSILQMKLTRTQTPAPAPAVVVPVRKEGRRQR